MKTMSVLENTYINEKCEKLEFSSKGRVVYGSGRVLKYTQKENTLRILDDDGEIWMIADISDGLLVPQANSPRQDEFITEKAKAERIANAPQRAAKELGIPAGKTLPKSGIMLRLIPAGVFIMGSPRSEDGRSEHEVQHAVKISKPFYMGKYEVTQGQWKKVMGNNPSHFKNVGENGPVEQVSWNDCQKFLRKLEELEGQPEGSMRLPTEAQWEYACRAGTQTVFCYGDDLDSSMANFDGNNPYGNGSEGEYRERTMPVGSFKPNAWGLYDMHGNVWEWCQDWSGPYATDDAVDPRGSNCDSNRLIHGGSLLDIANNCWSALRSIISPRGVNSKLFRVTRGGGWGWGCDASNCRSARRGGCVPDCINNEHVGLRLCLPAGQ